MTRPLALAAALLLASAPLGAQAARPAEVPAGARLRVYLRGARAPYDARLVRAAPDTLWVQASNADGARVTGEFAVAVADLFRLRWSHGPRTHVLRNGGLALGGGVLVGAVFGAIGGATDDDADWFEMSPFEGAVVFGILMGVPAGVVGAATGLVPTERLIEVALPSASRSPARPAATGPRVRPRLGLTRVPVRGGPAARALVVGLTVRPR